jgi:hypothetical protein
MGSFDPFRLRVDFTYGGCDPVTRKGGVALFPKRGDRTGMKADVRAQFESSGIEPVDGMRVLLIDEQTDADDEGRICDVVVPGILRWDSERRQWNATYNGDEMTWVPSESQ